MQILSATDTTSYVKDSFGESLLYATPPILAYDLKLRTIQKPRCKLSNLIIIRVSKTSLGYRGLQSVAIPFHSPF